MPLIPVLGRQRQVGHCEFEASLVYRTSSRTVQAILQRNPVSKIKTNKKEACILGNTFVLMGIPKIKIPETRVNSSPSNHLIHATSLGAWLYYH